MVYRIEQRLEEKIDDIPEETKESFFSALGGRDFGRPRRVLSGDRYLKLDLIKRMHEHLGVDSYFDSRLYRTINKEVLKRAYWGIVAFGEDRVPTEIVENLQDWDRVMFFAGMWTKRGEIDTKRPLSEIVEDYIEAGHRVMKDVHNRLRSEGKYKTDFKPKQKKKRSKSAVRKGNEIKERIRKSQDMFGAVSGFIDENEGRLDNERLSIMLDSCNNEELIKLTKRYGHEILGGYARYPESGNGGPSGAQQLFF